MGFKARTPGDPEWHSPRYSYDCDNCKFNWNCGPLCACHLAHQGYPEPPPKRAAEVARLLGEWRASRRST
jgi:hypothetical protein